MEDILNTYRYDGKRYWLKPDKGRWLSESAGAIKRSFLVKHNVPRSDIAAILRSIKTQSQSVKDPVWREEIAWLNFTKGRQLCFMGDEIHFCNRKSGRSTRTMKIADFNRVLRERFPSRKQVPDEGGMGYLFP